MIRLSLAPGKLTVQATDPNDWPALQNMAGKFKETGVGVFEYALSTQNLQRLYTMFTGPKKPVVVSGQWLLDKKRAELQTFFSSRKRLAEVTAADRFPVEPNGKFVPYAHQTKIVGSLLVYPYLLVASDCGTGKTGSQGRAMEIAIQRGLVQSGKILVSAPLSILETSWAEDLTKFTHLRFKILWTGISNKRVALGDEVLLCDYGPKPTDAVSTRTKKSVLYKSITGEIKQKLTELDVPRSNWTKYEAKYKEATDLQGNKTKFGECVGTPIGTDNTREKFIIESLQDKNVDVFIINHDGVRIYEEILKAHNFEWVIVDESTKIKSMQSKVTEAHINISWNCKRRTAMSGTPNPNGFVDLWSQFYFLDRGVTLHPALKDYLFDYFRAEVIGNFQVPKTGQKKDAVKYVIRTKEHQQQLIEQVKKSGIFLKQRDCVDLPPRTDLKRIVYLSPEQEKAYEDMEEELIASFDDKHTNSNVTVEAVNTLAKIMKLRQITSGFMAGNDGSIAAFKNNPKMEELDDFIDELGDNKLVIACQFKEEIYQLLERYKDRGVGAIFGDVKLSDRTDAIKRFQTTDDLQIMLLQPQAAAHGITLTAASYLLFFSLDYNFEFYYQTAKRIERLGQKSPIFIGHLLARFASGAPTIDEDLMDVLRGKNNDRDRLFNAGQDTIEIAHLLKQRLLARAGKH
jgi:SNF2 family DNA or RNA helicase